MTVRIGIIGSGDAGQALGAGFARHGYDVLVGTRTPANLEAWAATAKVRVGSPAEAAAHGELVVLVTLGAAAEEAIDLAGAANFRGKILIDVTNPLDFSNGMPPGLFVGTTDSLGERIQRKLPEARVVKAFNTVPNAQMVDPKFAQGSPPMLIAGDDAAAKKRVEEILLDVGWPGVVDIGGIEGARWLEAAVALWVRVGVATGTFSHVLAPIS